LALVCVAACNADPDQPAAAGTDTIGRAISTSVQPPRSRTLTSLAVEPGAQPAAGQGWRLLADEGVVGSWSSGLATDADQYDLLWDAIGLETGQPPVDFETEIVIWFGTVASSTPGCRPYVADVVVTEAPGRVYPREAGIDDELTSCAADANPHDVVLAVARERLPAPPFVVSVNDIAAAGGTQTEVAADLRQPGSAATAAELTTDLSVPDGPSFDFFNSRVVLLEGTHLASVEPVCEYTGFPTINATDWAATDPETARQFDQYRNFGIVEFEIVVEAAPRRLLVTSHGITVEYLPVDQPVTC
jgi:hypothetical protein